MQQGDRMQLNRLKMAIQYRQKKVSSKVEKFGHFKAHCHVLSFEWMEVLLTLHLQLSFHIIPICIVKKRSERKLKLCKNEDYVDRGHQPYQSEGF